MNGKAVEMDPGRAAKCVPTNANFEVAAAKSLILDERGSSVPSNVLMHSYSQTNVRIEGKRISGVFLKRLVPKREAIMYIIERMM